MRKTLNGHHTHTLTPKALHHEMTVEAHILHHLRRMLVVKDNTLLLQVLRTLLQDNGPASLRMVTHHHTTM